MDLSVKEKLVKLAIEEANKAIASGNSPFGAVMADLSGNVIETAYNTTNTDTDPTAHAEINLIRKVSKKIKSRNLSNYCLISNVQSCPMCFSAAVRSKISNFIFGCAEDDTLVPHITVFELSKLCRNEINIESKILETECLALLKKARLK